MAWSAGFVDTASYLQLRQLYTSHMTGNTASFGNHILQANWGEAWRYGWAILCFLAGLLISAALTEIERRERIRSAFSMVLGLEVALLAAFAAAGPGTPYALRVFFPSAAMGMQTVTVTRVGTLRIYTTYLTGSLSQFAEAVVSYAFWFRDRVHGRISSRLLKVLRVSPRKVPVQRAAVTAGLWIGFFAGVLAAAWGLRSWSRASLAAPMAVLAGTMIVDLRHPAKLGDVPGE